MKDQVKAIIQKEAERRWESEDMEAMEIWGIDKEQYVQRVLSENQWLIDAIPAALQGEDRWVSVEEGLPEEGQKVLITGEHHQVKLAEYTRGSFYRLEETLHPMDRFISVYYTPTHWQPLPELPSPPKQ